MPTSDGAAVGLVRADSVRSGFYPLDIMTHNLAKEKLKKLTLLFLSYWILPLELVHETKHLKLFVTTSSFPLFATHV